MWRYWHAETSAIWARWEPDADTVKSLLDRVNGLYDECQPGPIKARIRGLLHLVGEPSKMLRADTETTPD
jgi:hypothetical protein